MPIIVEADQSLVEPVNLAKASRAPLNASPAIIAVYDRNGFADPASEVITNLSTYALEQLRKDAEFVLYRGRRDADPSHILVVAPASEQPARGTLKRLEHEYALRTERDRPGRFDRWRLFATGGVRCWCSKPRAASTSIGFSSDHWN